MRIWAKIVLAFLALCELAVAALYVFGSFDNNPTSLKADPEVLRVAITLPFILVVIVGVPVTLAIFGWRFARRIFR